MLTSALREARNILLDQTSIDADAKAFQQIMDWMDAAPTPDEAAGMVRLLGSKAPWRDE